MNRFFKQIFHEIGLSLKLHMGNNLITEGNFLSKKEKDEKFFS
jgi:hypothetical protein